VASDPAAEAAERAEALAELAAESALAAGRLHRVEGRERPAGPLNPHCGGDFAQVRTMRTVFQKVPSRERM
jgi:hypothetical protein